MFDITKVHMKNMEMQEKFNMMNEMVNMLQNVKPEESSLTSTLKLVKKHLELKSRADMFKAFSSEDDGIDNLMTQNMNQQMQLTQLENQLKMIEAMMASQVPKDANGKPVKQAPGPMDAMIDNMIRSSNMQTNMKLISAITSGKDLDLGQVVQDAFKNSMKINQQRQSMNLMNGGMNTFNGNNMMGMMMQQQSSKMMNDMINGLINDMGSSINDTTSSKSSKSKSEGNPFRD